MTTFNLANFSDATEYFEYAGLKKTHRIATRYFQPNNEIITWLDTYAQDKWKWKNTWMDTRSYNTGDFVIDNRQEIVIDDPRIATLFKLTFG